MRTDKWEWLLMTDFDLERMHADDVERITMTRLLLLLQARRELGIPNLTVLWRDLP